jgi:hypothetical protein
MESKLHNFQLQNNLINTNRTEISTDRTFTQTTKETGKNKAKELW